MGRRRRGPLGSFRLPREPVGSKPAMMGQASSLRAAARRLATAALYLQLTACGPSFNFVYMSKDAQGNQKATKFLALGDEIHCVMEMVGGGRDTVIRLDLSGDGELRVPDNEFFPRPQGEQGPVFVDLQLFLLDAAGNKIEKGPWPTGSYNMDVFIDDSLEESLAFDIVQ